MSISSKIKAKKETVKHTKEGRRYKTRGLRTSTVWDKNKYDMDLQVSKAYGELKKKGEDE